MKKPVQSALLLVLLVLTACAPRAATSSAPATSAPAAAAPATSAPAAAAPATSAPAAAAPATSAPAASGNAVKVNISGFAFDPGTVTIKVGDTVTWTNQDAAVHTVAAADQSWKSDNLSKGASFSRTFTAAGTFAYICGVHPSMKGTVVVQ